MGFSTIESLTGMSVACDVKHVWGPEVMILNGVFLLGGMNSKDILPDLLEDTKIDALAGTCNGGDAGRAVKGASNNGKRIGTTNLPRRILFLSSQERKGPPSCQL